MNNWTIFWYCFCFLILSLEAWSQFPSEKTFLIQSLGNQDGLNSSEITALFQDQDGYIWVGNKPGVSRYDGFQFVNFTKTTNGPIGQIFSITEDATGTIWIGGQNGLFYFKQGAFFHSKIVDSPVQVIHLDREGTLWIGGVEFIPFSLKATQLKEVIDGKEVTVKAVASPDEWRIKTEDSRVWSIDTDPKGTVWLGLDNKRASFDGSSLHIHWEDTGMNPFYSAVAAITEDSIFWGSEKTPSFLQVGEAVEIVSEEAAYMPFKTEHSFYVLSTQRLLEYSGGKWKTLHNFDFYSSLYFKELIKDREGNFWIGCIGNLLKLTPSPFHSWSDADNPLLHSNHSISELSSGEILIGSSAGNVLKFTKDNFEKYTRVAKKNNSITTDIEDYLKNIVLYSTSMTGIVVDNQGLRTSYTQSNGLGDNGQYFLRSLDSNQIWSGGDGGISNIQISPAGELSFTNFMASIPGDGSDFPLFQDVFMGPDHTIWGISDKGLFRVEEERLIPWPFDHNQVSKYPIISDVGKDALGNVWLSTQAEGLLQCQFNSEGILQILRVWTLTEGLQSNIILNLHIDRQNRVWIANQSVISCLDINQAVVNIRHFNENDGILGAPSSKMELMESKDSLLWVLSQNSIMNFPLYELPTNEIPPQSFVSKVSLLGHEEDIFMYTKNQDLKFILPEHLILPHNKNALRFNFTSTSLTKPEKNRFQYRLQGLNTDWVDVGKDRTILFPDLRPGKYSFQVKSANNDGLWGAPSAPFKFQIKSPIWARWWAYVLYLSFATGLIVMVYRLQLTRKLALAESNRLKSLEELRSNIYTNITHEFRTPLSVILGMAKTLEEKGAQTAKNALDTTAKLIYKNGKDLLDLVNQMLDLSKLESGHHHLKPKQADIIEYLSYLTQNYHSLAAQKDIHLDFQSKTESLMMDFDPQAVQQIFSNLIVNAIKFSPEGRSVHILLEHLNSSSSVFRIKIKDHGPGIPEEEVPKIFHKFYQVKSNADFHQGTGIGLALTKELVTQMDGYIRVESQYQQGSTFIIELPITHNQPINKQLSLNGEMKTKKSFPTAPAKDQNLLELPVLLIIEDNQDISRYLSMSLQNQYHCVFAQDGQMGVEQALQLIPDLIICDVMMPKMDGFEVCKILKEDFRTDHIPIIMLTAKSAQENRLTGLATGADAYMIKPFDHHELLLRLDKLLENRKRLQAKYAQSSVQDLASPTIVKAPFLEKVEGIFIEHIESDTFSIDDLAQLLFLSRSQLHRKIKALTGHSTSIYLRQVRLEQAQSLLQDPDLSISEIAYRVGFKSPVYFSQTFKQTYGMSPSEHRKA